MPRLSTAILMFLALIFLQCQDQRDREAGPLVGVGNPADVPEPGETPNPNQWLVSPVFDGGPGKDGIPALEDPVMIATSQASYLRETDLVIGFVEGDEARAYPHPILDWHEIINDAVGGKEIAISYCPLTGTGIGYDRVINNTQTTFGVSGLLYENNLIPYDRATDSNWSQMLMKSVNGVLIGTQAKVVRVIETSWSTWKKMFPGTKVVSTNTGHDRPYDRYPYVRGASDYRDDHNFVLFPIGFDDKRLQRKDRVHGIIVNQRTKVYPFNSFGGQKTVINDVVNGQPVVVGVSGADNLIVSYLRTVSGVDLEFEIVTDNFEIYPFNLRSDDGTIWNVLGKAVSGPRVGQQLVPTLSYNSFWFAWGTFFRGADIYGQ